MDNFNYVYPRLRFGQGTVSLLNKKQNQVEAVWDTTPKHAYACPLNQILLIEQHLSPIVRALTAPIPSGRFVSECD